MALYAADGSINVTVVDGTTRTGLYAADGSWNVVVSDGIDHAGVYHPCGAYWVTVLEDGPEGIYATDGSLYVQESPYTYTGGLRVTVVSGNLGFSLTAPVLAFASATDPDSDNTQDFDLTVTAPEVDDVLTLQWDNNSDFSSVTGSDTYTIVIGDLTDFTGEITTGALADGAQYFRAKHSRGATDSAWSNTVTKVIDTTAPTLSNGTDTATGETTADVGVDTDEANGTLYVVVTTSSTSPTAAQVKLGQDNSGAAAAYASSQAISSTGTKAFSATGLTAATAYTAHFMHEDASSNKSTVVKGNGFTTDSASFTPADLFATYSDGFWLDAAQGTCSDEAGTTPVTSDGTTILNWQDQSGNGRHFSAASGGPVRKNSIVNSLPVMRFNNNVLNGATLAGLGSAAEIFAVVKITNDPSTTGQGGLWVLGTGISDHYPYTDGTLYAGAFSATRKDTGNPTPSLASAFRLINIWSAASDFALLIDGTSHYSTGTNTVGFSTAPKIGHSLNGVAVYLEGDIAEIIAFNAKLTAGERTSMKSYIATKYALTIA